MPKLAHALLHALKDHGVREIFGIPGDFVLPRLCHVGPPTETLDILPVINQWPS